MYYGTDVIQSNSVLMGLLVLCVLIGIAAFVFNKPIRRFVETRSIIKIFLIWLSAYLIEYYLFGPYSFISFVSEGNLSISYNHFLATTPNVGDFAARFVGGVDTAVFLPGIQHVQFEILLERFLPTWIVILAHKTVVGSLGFWGTWLLARKIAPDQTILAIGLAITLPLAHDYLLDYSTEFGTGFAVIPLAVYVGVAMVKRKRHYWLIALGTACLVAMAQPMKVFPPLAVAYLAAIIFFGLTNWKRSLATFFLFAGISALNWHEVIIGLLNVVPYTTRGVGAETDIVDVGVIAINGARLYSGIWPATIILLLALCIAFAHKNENRGRLLFISSLTYLSYVAATAIPWQVFGLAVVNRVEFSYNRLALPTIAAIVAAGTYRNAAIKTLGSGTIKTFKRAGESAILAIGLSLLVWVKATNAGQLLWFGGQSTLFGHRDLQTQAWVESSADPFRVVTLFDAPHPNVVAAFYGLESFDGGSNFDTVAYAEYWRAITRDKPDYARTTRTRIEWSAWNGEYYDLQKHLRIELLQAANVRYIISGLPIRDKRLRQVSGPSPSSSQYIKSTPAMFPSMAAYLSDRIAKIFQPGDHYIYEMSNAPRAFPGRSITRWQVDKNLDFYNLVAEVPFDGSVIINGKESDNLKDSSVVDFSINKVEKLPSGYGIAVTAPKGGILVLNQNHLPFWNACDDQGRHLPIVPANGIHMAVQMLADTEYVQFSYKRQPVRKALEGANTVSCPS